MWYTFCAKPMILIDRIVTLRSRSPCGERGLKFPRFSKCRLLPSSLPVRGVWIEMSLGEVGPLRLSDVDWKRGTIDISHALKYTPQTGSFEGPPKSEAGERIIALPVGMMAVLDQTRAYQEDCKRAAPHLWVGEGWIVHAWNGAQLHHDTPSRWFRHFADAHGFEGVRFHDLRHTHASTLLANGIDAVAVASRMGHEDASTTLRVYAHALRRRDDDAARVWQSFLDAAFAQPKTPEPVENDGFAPSPDAQ